MPTHKTITYTKIKKIDKDAFRCDIEAAIKASKIPEDDLQENLNIYLKLTQGTLDKHAPLSNRVVKTSKKVPWFTEEATVGIRKWTNVKRRSGGNPNYQMTTSTSTDNVN